MATANEKRPAISLRGISKFFRDFASALLSFHLLVGVLLVIVLALIEFWQVIRAAVR
jgi:Flp pilus assembly protein TadG